MTLELEAEYGKYSIVYLRKYYMVTTGIKVKFWDRFRVSP